MSDHVMTTYNRLPVSFTGGAGAWLTATDGKRYLDALSGISVCSIGHANPELTAALSDQAGKLIHTSNLYQIPLQEQLAERLCEVSGLDRVFFGNSGAEANEAAIKLCRKFAHEQGRNEPVIIVMQGSFHGRTLATLTATGNSKIKLGFDPLVPGFLEIPYDDITSLRKAATNGLQVVAVMLEPVQGEGGIRIPAPGYLKQVRDACDEFGWLLVLDEIQSGMCRTGRWFAFQHEAVKPDIMTLAKALGNGVPIGACLANERSAKAMVAGSHGSTFGGNPLAARAGLTVLHYMTAHHLYERAEQLGARLLAQLQAGLHNTSGIRDIRGKGMMLGIELEADCGNLVNLALQKELLVNVTAGNVIRLLPPLIIDEQESDLIGARVIEVVQEYLAG